MTRLDEALIWCAILIIVAPVAVFLNELAEQAAKAIGRRWNR